MTRKQLCFGWDQGWDKGGTEKRPEEILEGGKNILYHGCGSSCTCVHTECCCFFFFGLTVKHVGSQFNDQRSNLHPLHCKPGLPGKSELCILNECITLYINDLSIKLIFK